MTPPMRKASLPETDSDETITVDDDASDTYVITLVRVMPRPPATLASSGTCPAQAGGRVTLTGAGGEGASRDAGGVPARPEAGHGTGQSPPAQPGHPATAVRLRLPWALA